MKIRLLFGLMFAAVLMAGACGGTADNRSGANPPEKTSGPPPTKDELVALDQKAGEAWMNHDTHFFDTFLSDNFFGYGDTRWGDKQAAMNEIANHKCDVKSVKIEEPIMKMAGVDVAILVYKATYDGTCDGKKIPVMRAGSAFVRKGPLWLGAYHSETPIVTPPASGAKKADANKASSPADAKKNVKAETTGKEPADDKKTAEAPPANTTTANTTTSSETKPSADPALTEALLTVEKDGWNAWKDHDAKKLDEITTKDMIYIDSMGDLSPDKASTLKAWAEPCTVSSVDVSEAQSESVTAEVGILTYKATAVGNCGDHKLGPIWGATVFLNEGGTWRATFMIEKPA